MERMSEAIQHRGPDDKGTRLSSDRRATLASRRLAICDLSPHGHMPMSNEDGTVWVSFNGEIYNFAALRTELVALGHGFRSRSDTEVIVHGWESWGPLVLERLEGMFAIALYDERSASLLLARDRCGEKPIYYANGRNGDIIFASEIKAILSVWDRPRRVCAAGLSQYLTFGFAMPPHTLFDGIEKLAPGQAMLLRPGGRRQLWSYWHPGSDPEAAAAYRRLDPARLPALVLERLAESVRLRIVADVTVGASLSGGVDSSAVVALMSRISGRPVETVTVGQTGFGDLDETEWARSVASRVGARFNRVEVSEHELIGSLPDLAWHLDEPSGDPATVNSFIVSQYLRRNGTTVCLVGEGADELFLGYPNYMRFAKLAAVAPFLTRMPGPLARMIGFLGQAALGARGHSDLLCRLCRGEPVFLGTEVSFQGGDTLAVAGRASAEAVRSYPAAAVAKAVQMSAPDLIRSDALSLMSFSETRMRMAELLLMRVDKMSMAHSVEVRAPFLATPLVELALSLPGAKRAPGSVSKGLLKAALRGVVPDDVLDRRKQGFSTPVAHWLRGDLGRHLEARIGVSGAFRHGVVDASAVRRLLQAHRSGGWSARGHHVRLWNVLSFCEWYDRFGMQGVAHFGDGEKDGLACAA